MFRKIEIAALFVLICCVFATASQRQMFKIVPVPDTSALIKGDDTVRVDWVQLTHEGARTVEPAPAEARVYFSRTPAGGDLSRYMEIGHTIIANRPLQFTGDALKLRTEFIPNRQGSAMGPGTYYVIVAASVGDETFYSDYMTVMVESPNTPALVSPRANIISGQKVARINDRTPLFRWTPVDGVPYYHVMLADGPIVELQGSETKVSDTINIIWQAITPNTSITYGAPDPSGTINVFPPPLMPGRNYAWVVLNNFGNHSSYTSNEYDAMELISGQFAINGTPIGSPIVQFPVNNQLLNAGGNSTIEFRWGGIDTDAVSYLVNVFYEEDSDELGISGLSDTTITNKLVWEAVVPRGNVGAHGTLSVSMDAAGTLAGGRYKWRVYAIDSRGMASTGDRSVGMFRFEDNSGTVVFKASEVIGGVPLFIRGAEVGVEALSGPAQVPRTLYTGDSGAVTRSFPSGAYRFTVSKGGYGTQVFTVTVAKGDTVSVPVTMAKPEAALFGRVLAASDNTAIGAVRITAVSGWGDTLTTHTGGNGVFRLSARAGDWTVIVDKAGYGHTAPVRVSVRPGDTKDLGNIYMERNPLALSGVIRDQDGEPLFGARVRLIGGDGIMDELAFTPQNGLYVFYVMPGDYVVTAEKPGYVMTKRDVDVTDSRTLDIVLRSGAVLVNGAILGRSWNAAHNGGVGGFVTAPAGSATVSFWEKAEDGRAVDTFTVTADPQFGRFTASLPGGRDYNVSMEAPGFDAAGSRTELSLPESEGGADMVTFTHTLNALVAISGKVVSKGSATPLAGVDILVYDENRRTVASARTTANGAYEVRNIPNGNYTVGAGMNGYFASNQYTISVAEGRPAVNVLSYDFVMEEGNGAITWNVVGDNIRGVVNIMSPFNHTLDFVSGEPVTLYGAGPGAYVFEAVAESNPELLRLSYGTAAVSEAEEADPVQVYFPIGHVSPRTLEKGVNGRYALSVNQYTMPPNVTINAVELHFRSEGAARFASVVKDNFTIGEPYGVEFTPSGDGVNMQYYFVVRLSNGVTYGSSKQVFTTYVTPDPREISRLVLVPETPVDTLALPSYYDARFTLRAFYSDMFTVIDERENIGDIVWRLTDADGVEVSSGSGRSFEFKTSGNEGLMTLTAALAPSSPYVMRSGRSSTVTLPIRVTGSRLSSIIVHRRGEAGPILHPGSAAFVIEAFDGNNALVSVTPRWGLRLGASGEIDAEGVFRPSADFVGSAGIIASAEGVEAEYDGGQDVRYTIGNGANGVANTLLGMKFDFGNTRVDGDPIELAVTVPDLRNLIQRGHDFRIVGEYAFDVSALSVDRVTGEVLVVADVPAHHRDAARKGEQEFRIAKWFPDSLRWVPIKGSEVASDGATVSARLTSAPPSAQNRARASANASYELEEVAAWLSPQARYALVTKANRLRTSMRVSPHPFSPFIRPVREYGADAPEGTCVTVNVEAPEAVIKSIKVHIYNSTGMRVWAIEDMNAGNGENRYWWNGRTSGRGNGRTSVSEEMWTEDFHQRTMNRPLARNGRYFVAVIVTDINGKQKRMMKPLVLMK